MKKIALIAFAATASLALAACGSSTDASEDAIADTVEMPAEEAMADTPEPVEDPEAMADEVEMDAMEAAEAAEAMVEDDMAEETAE